MQEDVKPALNRRRLLRRAGTVAAGVGAAGVATVAAGSPAHATDTQPIVQGVTNTGANTSTGIVNASSDKPALVLGNNGGGPALQVSPDLQPSTSGPVGSVYVDRWGDVYTVGDQWPNPDGPGSIPGPKYNTPVYSSTWATMTMPISPTRWLVTLSSFNGGREFVVPGSADFDSLGRVLPKNKNNVPDLKLDFSWWLPGGGDAAVQGNLTIANATSGGWAALYNGNDWPGNSSINFPANQAIANFTQTMLAEDMTLSIKVQKPCAIIFDVLGFIVSDWISQMTEGGGGAGANAARSAVAKRGLQRRVPKQRG